MGTSNQILVKKKSNQETQNEKKCLKTKVKFTAFFLSKIVYTPKQFKNHVIKNENKTDSILEQI